MAPRTNARKESLDRKPDGGPVLISAAILEARLMKSAATNATSKGRISTVISFKY